MKTLTLSNEEKLQTGFTHKAVLDFADTAGTDFTAAATTQTFTLFTLAAGQVVDNIAYKLDTTFTSGTITALTIALGDNGSSTAYLTAKSVFTGATPITYAAGDGAATNQSAGKAYTAADAIKALFTATTANISTITAGKISIYFRVKDLTLV